MSRNELSLLFGAGDVSGWTSTGVSGFRGLKPTAAIRELIQNGLDAAGAAETLPARMHFEVADCSMDEIPGIKSYRKAFNGIQNSLPKIFGGTLPDNAEAITDDIKRCLAQKTCKVLYVLDNGIGLDKRRMCFLLGDGVSVKETGAMGSYGNGHVVAFPASDLRYVLYGGVSGGNIVASGHAILASRENEKKGKPALGKDGYLVKKLCSDDLLDRYIFCENEEIPKLLLDRLQWIQSQWGHGSVVAIPGFNHFNEQDDASQSSLRNMVFRASACNFFEAIYRQELVVHVNVGGQTFALDQHNIVDVLEEFRLEKRSPDSFLSGNKAYEAFLTLRDGREVEIDTPMGKVGAIVRYPVEGSTRTDLCRSGMWITDSLPRFQNQFGNVKAFHCLLLLRVNKAFNRLVRKAEGPLHNELHLRQLKPADRKQLGRVFAAIRDQLRKEVPALDAETFRPSDIFLLPTGGFAKGGRLPGYKGVASTVRRRKPGSDTGGGGGGGGQGRGSGSGRGRGRAGTFKRGGNQTRFSAVILPTGARACRTLIVPEEKLPRGEIRFAIDESIDVTSDSASSEVYAILKPSTIRVNNQKIRDDQLVKKVVGKEVKKDGETEVLDEELVLGILLGEINKGEECLVELEYSLPDDLPLTDDRPVVLKAELLRRARLSAEPKEQ